MGVSGRKGPSAQSVFSLSACSGLDIENGGKGRLEEEEEERRWSETYVEIVCLALAFKFRIFNAFSRSLSGLRGSSIRRFGALNNFRR